MACLEPCVTVAYLEPCHIQNPEIFRIHDIFRTLLRHILVYSERLRNARILRTPPIFRTLPYLEFWHVYKYSELCNISNPTHLEFFARIVKNYNFFSNVLHLRSLAKFCIRLNKYSLTCRVTLRHGTLFIVWYKFRNLSIIVNSDIYRYIHVLFRHFQPYCGMLRTLCNCCIFRALPYSESWNI